MLRRVGLVGVVFGAMSLSAASESVAVEGWADWAQTGHLRFEQCEFKGAAFAFRKALRSQPEDANLYYWLGKSYARMAEVASPVGAPRDARRARTSLERAVELEPRNREYLRELFDLHLSSAEWFSGSPDDAARLVERIEPDDPGAQELLRKLVQGAREEYRGATWRIRQATLLPSGQLGRILP